MKNSRLILWAILGGVIGIVFGYTLESLTNTARDPFGEWLFGWLFGGYGRDGDTSWFWWMVAGVVMATLVTCLRGTKSN